MSSAADKDVVAEYLRSVPDVTSMTINQVRSAVEERSGRAVDKAVVRDAIQEFLEAQAAAVAQTEVANAPGAAAVGEGAMEVSGDDDAPTDEGEEEEEEDAADDGANDEDGEGEGLDDFDPAWRARFHDVVWARTSPSYPWYYIYIYI